MNFHMFAMTKIKGKILLDAGPQYGENFTLTVHNFPAEYLHVSVIRASPIFFLLFLAFKLL